MQRRMLALLATTAAAAATVVPAPALAHGSHGGHGGHGSPPKVTVLNSTVGSPFNLELTRRGILVADGGAEEGAPGLISKLRRDGTLTTVVPDVIGASGVASSRRALAYTSTTSDPDTHENTAASLEIQYRYGKHVHADTLAYEQANNPDQVNTYGIANPTQCQSDLLEPLGGANYTGAIDSHAYSVAKWGRSWLLADAGGNDLLKIDGRGHISTVAVFPPQQIKVTQAFLDASFPPDVDTSCLLGATYGFEPVPTDVEVGRDGYLYVTTLPGGAEDDSLGANGAVWRVSPWSGHVKKIASGFLGATNLALSNGKIYVTELFAGRVSVVDGHHGSPYVDLPGALSIEAGPHGTLYAGTFGAFSQSASTIVRIDGRHHHHHHHGYRH
jgi:hypothetical protein